MCTVSFYKDNSKVIITSNRDEHINRPSAIPPQKMIFGEKILYYPKDPKAGGTWFAVNQKGNVYVLLNGSNEKHTPNPPYRKSRGLILLDIADSNDIIEKWQLMNLQSIENFTIVSYFDGQLIQFRWNGIEKSQLILDENESHIWSSATLYDKETIIKREEWFHDFLENHKNGITSHNFFEFHTDTKKEDQNNGLLINRDHKMLTKSVTQAVITSNRFTIEHRDLITDNYTLIEDFIR